MRLVSWNANYNGRRRSLDDSVALLEPFGGELLVICEAGKPAKHSGLRAHYVGDAPGLAVVAREGLHLEPHPENDAAPDYMAGFHVSGDATFDLLAIWPVSRPEEISYHKILMAALDHYVELLGSGRAVMIGDLNSSSRVLAQKRTHPRFVSAASELGLVSLYHEQTGEGHGLESANTYRHSSGATRDFHIDYCFLSRELAAASEISIPQDEDWMRLSDHYPLVVDFPAGTSLTSASS